MSGSAMNSWAVTEEPLAPSLRIAELSFCFDPLSDVDAEGNPDLPAITQCMKTAHVDYMVAALSQYQVFVKHKGTHLYGLHFE
jgi:hypothetical protein